MGESETVGRRPRQYSPRLILGLVAKNCITGPIFSSSFSAFKALSPPSLRGGIDGRRKLLLLSKRGERGGREEGGNFFTEEEEAMDGRRKKREGLFLLVLFFGGGFL